MENSAQLIVLLWLLTEQKEADTVYEYTRHQQHLNTSPPTNLHLLLHFYNTPQECYRIRKTNLLDVP